MKTKLLLLLFTVVFITANLHAADFTLNGIAYTITSTTEPYTVAVRSKSPGYTGAVTIPDKVSYNSIDYSVTSIGVSAFQNCTGLTAVTIPNSVSSIGTQAFCYCEGLTPVTIPNSVTTIGDKAFYNCIGLTLVIIPAALTYIGSEAFSGVGSFDVNSNNPNYSSIDGVFYNKDQTTLIHCPRLKTGSFVIPSSVTSIANGAFIGCESLTSVTIPKLLTTIGDNAFYACYHLTSAILPNTVTTIGDYTFAHCEKLITFTIPESVTSIGEFAFYDCTGLTSVSINNSITSIKRYAFEDCTRLTSIYADSPTPIDLSSSPYVFYNVNKTMCTLYVPTGSKSLYAAADQWKDFINIVEHIVTDIAVVSASRLNIRLMGRRLEIGLPETSAYVQVTDISGRQLYNGTPSGSILSLTLPQAGIYLVRVGNNVAKLVAP
jgi:hypothetical protein